MMVLKYTPKFESVKAPDFNLLNVDNACLSLADVMGPEGLVVMFICNHCPYVKSIQQAMVNDAHTLIKMGVNVVAIMSNDPQEYPEDSFENMQKVAKKWAYPFPYLIDQDQQVAQAYGAVCTPDIFGLNAQGEIKYRGRLDAAGINESHDGLRRDLVVAMEELVQTGEINSVQHPSMGCSIKWTQNSKQLN